jgi:beta-xylosidase
MKRSTRSSFGVVAALACVALLLGGCAAEPAATPNAEPVPFLIDQDFADPDVIESSGTYVAFGINTRAVNVQFAISEDLVEWDVSLEDALPELPEWATTGRTWAPDVSVLGDGTFIMYFTATHAASNKQCIGAATSPVVTGPYTPVAGEPLVCTLDEGGAIDPAAFTDDDGTRYLIWKNDGNCCDLPTWIQLVPLTPDGTLPAGQAMKLFSQTEPWEGKLVEGPVLVERDGKYVVFYSANDYASNDYAIGVATADDITGPYVKADGPLLSTDSSNGRYLGPGGQEIISTAGGDVLVFHGWEELHLYRGLLTTPLEWDGAVPSVRLP